VPRVLLCLTSIFRRQAILIWGISILVAGFCQAQITDVTNITSTPVPGVGHDYIHDLNEIVNPANGSVSVRIAAPIPHERGLNTPAYIYTYDSDGWLQLRLNGTISGCQTGPGPTACLGRVDGPQLTLSSSGNGSIGPNPPNTVTSQNYSLSFSQGVDNGTYTCNYIAGFIYTDPEGGRHPLGGVIAQGGTAPAGSGCAYFGITNRSFAGDEHYKAELIGSDYQVSDSHGNILGGGVTGGEDTNGNYRIGSGRPWTYQYGTVGGVQNTLISMTPPGSSAPYSFSYESAPYDFSLGVTLLSSSSANCYNDPQFAGGSIPAQVKIITLPNEQTYQFDYDSTYGLLKKITYPTGATVTYTWGINGQSELLGYLANQYVLGAGITDQLDCFYVHDWPAIQKRIVSFDGTNPAIEQDFAYSTTWSSPTSFPQWTTKQTTITTKDLLRSGQPSFQTVYNYVPLGESPQDPMSTSTPILLPVEDTVVYQDVGGQVLKTVKKVWNYYNQLAAECDIYDSSHIAAKFYQYEPYSWGNGNSGWGNFSNTTDLLTDVKEYDYGIVGSNCQQPSSTPTRETKTTYATFGNTPLWPTGQYMSDRPSTVQVYNSQGQLWSEIDYSYDLANGGAAVHGVTPAPLGHDETYYSASMNVRGNVTTITKKCFVPTSGATCQDSTAQIIYDETGQPLSVKDGRGNTTQVSYTDEFTGGTPPGNTNTYPTTIARPTTNGVAHAQSFKYDYLSGQLSVATDENNQVSHYYYNDPWNRLTEADFPDGGNTTVSYIDAGSKPYSTTSHLLNSTGTQKVSKTTKITMDGMGHVIQTELTSDPCGADDVDTSYDGLGRIQTVSNPYRLSSTCPNNETTTNGTTTYMYDALGRKTLQTNQDGNTTQQWNYTGNVVMFTDEDGNQWQRTSDALGRLTNVVEPGGRQTGYSYDALDNLLAATQNGTNGEIPRARSFTYDSLSHLISANNPEAGRVCYEVSSAAGCNNAADGYDANGNLVAKTDSRGVTTSYSYDALNRLLSKSYSDGSPSSCFQYDSGATNGIGRVTYEWTQAGSCPASVPSSGFLTLRSVLAYDPMGRVSSERQCTPTKCSAGSGPSLGYTYDLAGNATGLTNSVGTPSGQLALTTSFDSAAHMNSVTSNWAVYPTNLYTLPSGGYGPVGPLNWTMGPTLSVTQSYTNRLWINSITATGQVP